MNITKEEFDKYEKALEHCGRFQMNALMENTGLSHITLLQLMHNYEDLKRDFYG